MGMGGPRDGWGSALQISQRMTKDRVYASKTQAGYTAPIGGSTCSRRGLIGYSRQPITIYITPVTARTMVSTRF